jgi:hypothetical protein
MGKRLNEQILTGPEQGEKGKKSIRPYPVHWLASNPASKIRKLPSGNPLWVLYWRYNGNGNGNGNERKENRLERDTN